MGKKQESKKKIKLDSSNACVSYSTNISIRMTMEEAELAFGVIKDSSDEEIVITNRIFISMPHLFRLKDALTKVCEDFVENYNKKENQLNVSSHESDHEKEGNTNK